VPELHTTQFQFLQKPYNTQVLSFFNKLFLFSYSPFFERLTMIEKNNKRGLGTMDNEASHGSN
jgi:hypothetical protein